MPRKSKAPGDRRALVVKELDKHFRSTIARDAKAVVMGGDENLLSLMHLTSVSNALLSLNLGRISLVLKFLQQERLDLQLLLTAATALAREEKTTRVLPTIRRFQKQIAQLETWMQALAITLPPHTH